MPVPIDWPRRTVAEAWRGPETSVVVCVTIDVDAESPVLARGEHYASHLTTMSHQAYGPLVGVPRLLEILAGTGVPATFFIPGESVERWPHVVEKVLEAEHEIALHGYTHRHPVHLDMDEQRSEIDRSLELMTGLGVRPTGYRAPNWEMTRFTLDHLAACGISYDSSLMDDDRPYVMELGGTRLAELPPHWSLDDWEQYFFVPEPDIGQRIVPPTQALELWSLELAAMRRWGGLLVLTLHPFLSGRPSRAIAVEHFINLAREHPDVEFARCDQVAQRVLDMDS